MSKLKARLNLILMYVHLLRSYPALYLNNLLYCCAKSYALDRSEQNEVIRSSMHKKTRL